MKKEAKQYSAEEKTKIALEALRGELTYAQITIVDPEVKTNFSVV